jgi:hypothetical protein
MLHVLVRMFNILYRIMCNIGIVAFIADGEVVCWINCIKGKLKVSYDGLGVVLVMIKSCYCSCII